MISKQELQDLYWNQGLSIRMIAQKKRYGKETIRNLMEKYGIPRRRKQVGPISKETLERLYFQEKLSLNQIANKLKCSISTVFRWMEAYKLKRRDVSLATKLNPPTPSNKLFIPEEELRELYCNRRLSLKQIASKLHYSLSTVYRYMERYNIPRRLKSEAIRLNPPKISSDAVRKLNKELWSKPEYRKRMVRISVRNLRKAHELWNDPAFRKIRSDRMREVSRRLLSDPTYRKKAIMTLISPESRMKAIKAVHQNPNKPERRLNRLLQSNHLPFKFTGDGQFLIGRLNPDFVHNNGKKQVIEIFGRTYHDPHVSFRDVPILQTVEGRIEYFKKYGWQCLVIWDDEILEHEDEVLTKVKNFMEVS
jgi:very-short-patch-repair endonuclease